MDIEFIYKTVPFSKLNIGDVFEIPRKASDNSPRSMYMKVDSGLTLLSKNSINLKNGEFHRFDSESVVRKLNGKFVAYD